MTFYFSPPEVPCYDNNDNSAIIPELWVYEGLRELEEQMVVAQLVYRDFEDKIAQFGDVVNCHRPADFRITRKTDATTSLDKQKASLTSVRVPLNQWFYTSFVIKDGEQSYAPVDLIEKYIRPAMRTISRGIDRSILGYAIHAFLRSQAGRLGKLDKTNCADYLLEAREQLNTNNAPLGDARSLLLNPVSETCFLKNDLFIAANQRGDGGEALENARLGRVHGFGTFMAQNVPHVSEVTVDVTTAQLGDAVTVGQTTAMSIPITGYTAEAGQYMVVVGDDKPLTIKTVTTNVGDTVTITANEPITSDCASGSVVKIYNTNLVNGNFDKGHEKEISIDGYAAGKTPQVGQIISFGTGTARHTYTIIQIEVGVSSTEVYLDRPLDAGLADDEKCYLGPAGSFNFAFHREALALVSRPLDLPSSLTGVLAGTATYNDLNMRVTMQYSIDSGGTLVNCDMLAGIQALDTNLGVILLG